MEIIKNNKGGSLIEFALVFPIYLFLILGVSQLIVFSYQKLAIQHSVNKAARFALTGQSISSHSRADSVALKIQQFSKNYGLSIDNNFIKICPVNSEDTSGNNCTSNSVGDPDDFIRITISKNVTSLVPALNLRINSSVIFKNEHYKI